LAFLNLLQAARSTPPFHGISGVESGQAAAK
jgi:hypothetical protein